MSAFTSEQQAEIAELVRCETDRLGTLVRQLQGAVPIVGVGSPAGILAAPVGTLYRRADGAASTTLYVKESGTGTSGWRAV